MKRGWHIYSLWRNRQGIYHIGIAFYTGKMRSSGGLETTKDRSFELTEEELINLLLTKDDLDKALDFIRTH